MYLDHFRLAQEPFSIAPDPSFLYLSDSHNEALAHLLYGFSHGGFVLVTGEVGTGKTTLLRNLVKQTPDALDVAFVLNPRLTVRELLETICDELGITYDKAATETVKQYIDVLNAHLLKVHRQGRSTVLIIDEAQNLSPAVLEQIRLLTNLETDEKKLLRIILIGQPELDDMLARQELRQLAQRITARYHLRALNAADTSAYVAHRITRAGGQADIFPEAARKALFRTSGGIPRLINVIADRALLGAYTQGAYQVTPALVRSAAREIAGLGRQPRWTYPWVATGAIGIILLAMAWALWRVEPPDAQTSEPKPAPAQQVPAELPKDEPQKSDVVAARESPPVPAETAQSNIEDAPEPAAPSRRADERISRPPGSTYLAQRQAYAALFDRWSLTYDPASAVVPCDFAPQHGLICTSRRGAWTDLARIDLPVVLELWDDQPMPFYAALLGMQDEQLWLGVGGETYQTSPRMLRELWFGNYTIAWLAPRHYRGNLSEGETNANVGVLRERLARALDVNLGGADPNTSNTFGPELADALERFQVREGLATDRIVGPLTWIALSKREGADMPRLSEYR